MGLTESDARAAVSRHLHSGERLVWSGQPEPGRRFRPGDWFLIPFGVIWLVFILFWEAAALTGALAAGGDLSAWIFPLFGIPFLVIGWYLNFGRFRMREARRRRTVYAVTDRRVIGVEIGSPDSVRSVFLEGLPGVGVRAGDDGVGTLTFEPSPAMWAMYADSGLEWVMGGTSVLPLAFYHVKDAAAVAELIDHQRTDLRRDAPHPHTISMASPNE